MEWEYQALHAIEKTDGKRDPKEVLIDAIGQLIDEKLNAFGYYYGIFTPDSNPAEGIAYAELRLKTALDRL